MKKHTSTALPGFTNNSSLSEKAAFPSLLWQHSHPHSVNVPWPRSRPALLTIPRTQLKQLMLQARKYDPRAIETFTELALPIAKHYSSLPKVISVLGKEEAYSIASHTLMDFLMHERLREEEQDIPTMLKQAIRCDLKNQMDRIKNRRQYETYNKPANSQSEEDDEDTDVTASLPGDPRLEPEHMALLAEQKRLVQECLVCLTPKEKQVINGIFFRQLSVEEIAAELHCSPNIVSTAKYRALKRLRKLFIERQIS